MKNLSKHLLEVNNRESLWNEYSTIVVGVSGGADSVCLLDVLHRLSTKCSLKLVIAHVNYGMRGRASDRDQKHVVALAQKYKLPIEIFAPAKNDVGQNEESWRDLRYEFFARVAEAYSAHSVAVAHNQNDQSETLLLNLLRGSGLAGLRAMPYSSSLKFNSKDLKLIRPLLAVSRVDILTHNEKFKLLYHNDSSNKDNSFTRNRIRNKLIPLLQKDYNPNIISTLAATAKTLAADAQELTDTQKIFWKHSRKKNQISFNAGTFEKLSKSQQQNGLRTIFEILAPEQSAVSEGFISECNKLAHSQKNKNKILRGNGLKCSKNGAIVSLTSL